jgi:hypothetical protein
MQTAVRYLHPGVPVGKGSFELTPRTGIKKAIEPSDSNFIHVLETSIWKGDCDDTFMENEFG